MHRRNVLFVLICSALWGNVLAQGNQRTITKTYRNELVSKILEDIGRKTDVFFSGGIRNSSLRTSVTFRHCTAEEALDKLLPPLGYKWKGEGVMYSIKYAGPYFKIVTGIVRNEQQQPLDNINITVEDTTQAVRSDSSGRFELYDVPEKAILVFTSVNTEKKSIVLQGKNHLEIILQSKIDSLTDVIVSNGITAIDSNDIPAFSTTDLTQYLTKRTTERIANTATGLLSLKDKLRIRTTSTILANQQPLIILDDVPFDGSIDDILPDEIESITILKDALATAIWGARAGNGAIVIKRKRSRFKQPRQIQFSSGFYYTPKTNLYKNRSFLPSAAFIEVEKFLFNNGYYNQALLDPRIPVSPVAQILHDQKTGLIGEAEMQFKLDSLSHIDVRDDLSNHFYRNEISQLFNFSASGADALHAYYLFMGYNGTTTGLVGNRQQQYIINLNNTLHLFNNKLDLTTGFRTSVQKRQDNNPGVLADLYPYTKLVGDDGEALSVEKENKDSYLTTADVGRLLDWKYKPLNELTSANNQTDILHYIGDLELNYKFNKNLLAKAWCRMERRTMTNDDLRSMETWYTRNMINMYTQVNGTSINYGIPPGAILNKKASDYRSDNLGLRVFYTNKWDTASRGAQILNLVLGGDIRRTDIKTHEERLYGYDDKLKTKGNPNYMTLYKIFGTSTVQQVPYVNKTVMKNDNVMSAFLTASYIYHDQLSVSGSLRQDAFNTFESTANAPFAPFWSVGLGWDLSQADLYKGNLQRLRVRGTLGTTGNMYTRISGRQSFFFTTDEQTNQLIAVPVSPPDPDACWEKSVITNIGFDVETKNRWLVLSLDLYNRNSTGLFANTHIDRTTGYSDIITNSAEMNGKGVELNLTLSKKWQQNCSWEGTVGFNYAKEKVTRYRGTASRVGDYFTPGKTTPLEGHSLDALFSLRTMGLDANGQLQGVYKGRSSNAFNTILQSTDLAETLVDEGSAVPLFFGVVNNSFHLNGFSLSVSINYKLNWYFRRSSVNYNDLFNNRIGHTDLLLRWKQSGDEAKTFVPAMTYPADKSENVYYSVSELLVAKGDNIRLQDIMLGYTFNKKSSWLPFKKLNLYLCASNPGILWRANKYGLDPEDPDGYSQPPTFTFGLNVVL